MSSYLFFCKIYSTDSVGSIIYGVRDLMLIWTKSYMSFVISKLSLFNIVNVTKLGFSHYFFCSTDRHVEKESLAEYIAKKREMFLVQVSDFFPLLQIKMNVNQNITYFQKICLTICYLFFTLGKNICIL